MPRRISPEDVLAAVNEAWPIGQEEVQASALRDALENAGNGDMIPFLRVLKNNRQLYGYVRLNPDGSTTHLLRKNAPG